jgi:TRAP-type C4-dicarboxylate transport system permease small subunit
MRGDDRNRRLSMRNIVGRVRSILDRISGGFNWFAIVLICFMVVSTVLDVIFREAGTPLKGIFELNEAAMGMAVYSALAYTWMKGGHVRIDLVIRRVSPRMRALANATAAAIGCVVFGLISWRTAIWAFYSLQMSETTDILHISVAPIKFLVSVASGIMTVQVFVSLLDSYSQTSAKGPI